MKIKRLVGSKEIIATGLAGLAVILYLCFLAYNNYRIETGHENRLLEMERQRVERAGAVLGLFLTQTKNALMELRSMPEVDLYFAGGSQPVSSLRKTEKKQEELRGKALFELIQQKLAGGNNPYSRIILADLHGRSLLEVPSRDRQGVSLMTAGDVKDLFQKGSRKETIELLGDNKGAVVSIRYRSKGLETGYIMALIDTSELFKRIENSKTPSGEGQYILYNDRNSLLGDDRPIVSTGKALGNVETLAPDMPSLIRLNESKDADVKVIALRTPIADSTLFLVRIIPALSVYKGITGPFYSAMMFLLALAVLAGVVSVIRINMKLITLKARLDDTSSKEWETEKKNRELETEASEREKTEEKARQHERFLEAMIEHIPVAIYVKSVQDGRFILWNKAGEKLFGISKDQTIGKTDYDLLTREEADRISERDLNVLKQHVYVDVPEEYIQSPSLGTRVLHSRKVPIYDDTGQPLYLLSIAEDITDLKKAEKALIESEEQYRTAVEHSNDGIAISNGDHFIYMNRSFRIMHGYEELADWEPLKLSMVIHPEDLKQISVYYAMRQQGGSPPACHECRGLRKDGSTFTAEVSVATITIQGKHCVLVYVRDISERKEAELLEQKRARDLAEMVQELQLFNRLTVGRELRMVELKKQVNGLLLRLGETPLYDTDEIEAAHEANTPER